MCVKNFFLMAPFIFTPYSKTEKCLDDLMYRYLFNIIKYLFNQLLNENIEKKKKLKVKFHLNWALWNVAVSILVIN